jgi:hypothetical protein
VRLRVIDNFLLGGAHWVIGENSGSVTLILLTSWATDFHVNSRMISSDVLCQKRRGGGLALAGDFSSG